MKRSYLQNNPTLWSSLGAGIEYYDFVVFAYLAPFLATVFFDDTSTSGLIKTYMIYATGYFARPLGSFICGCFGDVKGRYRTFLNIMYTMAFSTLAMGFLPSFESVGIVAAIMLCLLRFFQGISFGAELPGAIVVVSEHVDRETHGRHCGIVISSITVGSILASSVVWMMTTFFETSTITLWAWRLPFWFGGAMGLFVVWVRENLEETPEFLQIEHQQRHQSIWKPAGDILRAHKRHIFAGISLSLIHAALVTTYLYFPLFIYKFYGHAKSDIYCAMTLGLVWCALIIPRIGRLADSLGRRVLYTLTGIGFLMVMTPSLHLLSLGFGGLVAFCMLFQVFIAGFVSSYFPLLVELFPTQVRFTAIALCYNITYALISLLPVAFSTLLDQPPTILSHILTGLCGVSLAGCLMVKKQSLV